MAHSLRFWLALGLSTVVGAATVLAVSVVLGVLLPRLNAQVESSNHSLAVALSRQVDDFLRGSALALERVAAEIEAMPDAAPERTRVVVDTLANAHAPIDALYVLDSSALVVDVGLPLEGRKGRGDLLGLDFSARKFVAGSRPAGAVTWSDSYLSLRGKIVVAASVALRSQVAPKQSSEHRTLVGEVDLEQLSVRVVELGSAAGVLPMIVDRLGQVVAHPDTGRAAGQENLGNLPLIRAGLAGHFSTERFIFDGHDYIGSVSPIGSSGWLALVAQPTELAFATMRSTLLAIIGGTAAALALALLSAYVFGQLLVRRVADFSRHVQAIADGDYTAPLPSSRTEELINLTISMRRMANAIVDREAALVASEGRYRALFRDAPLAYQSIDVSSSKVVEVNEAWLALLGYRREEVVGRPISAFLAEHSLPAQTAVLQHFVGEGRIDDLMINVRHKDGKAITVLISGRIHRDAHGEARTHCILADITERQRLEEAQRQASARLKHQAERAVAMLELPKAAERMDENDFVQHGLAVVERLTDSQIAFLYFVNADRQMSDSVIWSHGTRKRCSDALADTLCATSVAGIWAAAMQQRGPLIYDDSSTSANGRLPVEAPGLERLISVPVIEGGIGRMMVAVGNKPRPYCEGDIETTRLIGQDIWRIVNQRRADEAQRLAATVFSASTSGICIADAQRRIVSVNPALSTITGYPPDEIIGQTPQLFASECQNDDGYLELWAGVTEHGEWRGEIWNRRKSGEVFPAWLTLTAVRNSDGLVTHYIGSFYDITERKRAEEHIRFLAHHDALTQLPNRTLLDDRFRQAIVKSRRDRKRTAVLFLDLDRFKLINDTLGHDAGDRLLASVAGRLQAALRSTETVARLGGDEFIIIIPDIPDIAHVALVAQKVLDVVSSPHLIDDRPLHVTPSLGISVYPDDGDDVPTLLRHADTAMYHAKECGRNNFQFFTPAMNLAVQERVSIEHDLRTAIANGEFELFYQPQVDCRSGNVTGMEALLRWHHPQRGLVSPHRFIPIAEETGLIVPIGEWVLRAACRQARCWHDAGQTGLRISVNLSTRQLQQPDLGERISSCLAESGLPASALELELTESMLMADPVSATTLLRSLDGLGIRLAIDDFGTGYSSLAYLKRFPVSRLKIDRSFVRDLSSDANDAAIVRAVVALAENLRMDVIAEGVETVDQMRFLERHDCFEVQGYLFSQPRPAAEFSSFRFALPVADGD